MRLPSLSRWKVAIVLAIGASLALTQPLYFQFLFMLDQVKAAAR